MSPTTCVHVGLLKLRVGDHDDGPVPTWYVPKNSHRMTLTGVVARIPIRMLSSHTQNVVQKWHGLGLG